MYLLYSFVVNGKPKPSIGPIGSWEFNKELVCKF